MENLTVIAVILRCNRHGSGRHLGSRLPQLVVIIAKVEDEDLLRQRHVIVAGFVLGSNVTLFAAPGLDVSATPRTHGRLARSETVAHVALEDDTVALGEPEGLVVALQSCSIRNETWEDGRVHGAPETIHQRPYHSWTNGVVSFDLPVVIDDLESATRVLSHGSAAAGEDTVRSCFDVKKI